MPNVATTTAPSNLAASFATFLEDCTLRRRSPLTVRAYAMGLRFFREHLEAALERPANVADVTVERVRGWLASMSDRSAATTQQRLMILRSWGSWACDERQIEDSSAHRVRTPKLPKRKPRDVSEEAVATMIEAPALERDPSGARAIRDRAVLELLYATGVRVAEASAINVDDLDLDAGMLRVIHGKGDKERMVPLGAGAIEAVRVWLLARAPLVASTGERALWVSVPRADGCGSSGKRLGPQGIRALVGSYSAPGKRVTPHQLRHSFATHLLRQRADLVCVSRMLGHSSLSITERYTHMDDADLRRVHELAHPRAKRAA